ncbi:DAK2 domain-containing protein [Mycolicibacterium frederiksbergense]|uniref:DAK2 domain-containing protein n=1 Tax=Mycolicibacterium frederiksbergense TaxID=117567 RepID=UPI0039998B31
MSAARLDASAMRRWAHTAVGHLITHTDEINRLNVFPVADSDTGTNMLFTMRSAVAGLAGGEDLDLVGVTGCLADGALRGARGNSGVILSQILRGISDVTAEGHLSEIGGSSFAAALRCAEGLVVASMGEAVPGTIVSVLGAAADTAEQSAAGGADVGTVVDAAASAAFAALERTTDQLDVLAEAGVVDAGGRGLLVLLDALTATLIGSAPRRPAYAPAAGTPEPAVGSAAAPQFEVMYLLDGCRAESVEGLRATLAALGDSVAITAGRSGTQSVHVHTDDAGAAVEAGLAVGSPSNIQITVLTGARPVPTAGRDRAVLAVVDGDGAATLFAGEGARVLRPHDGVPISAQQLLRALVDADAAQIMVLPNGFIAAEELVAGCTAATGWGIDVVPVPTASMVQGLAALAVHDATRQGVDDGYTMARAAAAARHGSVRVATDDALTWAGHCKPGDGLGISGDEVLIVGRDVVSAGSGLIDLLLAAGGELITVLIGSGVDEGVGERLREHVRQQHLGAELVSYRTGHDGDALLIGVE